MNPNHLYYNPSNPGYPPMGPPDGRQNSGYGQKHWGDHNMNDPNQRHTNDNNSPMHPGDSHGTYGPSNPNKKQENSGYKGKNYRKDYRYHYDNPNGKFFHLKNKGGNGDTPNPHTTPDDTTDKDTHT